MSQSQKICDQPIMAQETDYFMSLLKAEAFSVTGSKMQLNTSDNWTLFYDRAP
jgi:heat shock protein HslJ